jgi:hypothetical protein
MLACEGQQWCASDHFGAVLRVFVTRFGVDGFLHSLDGLLAFANDSWQHHFRGTRNQIEESMRILVPLVCIMIKCTSTSEC